MIIAAHNKSRPLLQAAIVEEIKLWNADISTNALRKGEKPLAADELQYTDEIIRAELDDGWCDHVEKFLHSGILLSRRVSFRLFCHKAYFPFHFIGIIEKAATFCRHII